MSQASAPSTTAGPGAVAESLVTTLREEHGALGKLSALFEAQLQAVRDREPDQLDEATYRVTEQLAVIERLRQQRDRQVRLLGRVLASGGTGIAPMAEKLLALPETAVVGAELMAVRDQVMSRARETQTKGQVLAFAIQYAAALGRDMLQAAQGIQIPASAHVYTSAGARANASQRMTYVNHVG